MERTSRLKVLVHSPYPVRSGFPGGVNSYIQEITPHLEALGCRVRVLGPAFERPPFEYPSQDLADYHLGTARAFSVNGTNFEAGICFGKRAARRIIEVVRPDLIVSHEPAVPNSAHTLISGIPQRFDGRRSVPLIGQFHAGRPAGGMDLVTKLYQVGLRGVMRPRFRYGLPVGMTNGYIKTLALGMAGRIAVSQATATLWEELFPGKYHVIYNGIDVDALTPEGPRLKAWDDGKRTILFAARHDRRKGSDYLLQAYFNLRRSGVHDIKLKLTGQGEMTAELQETVRRERIPDVEFLGVLPRDQLVRAFRTADLFVACSIGGEGFTRTIGEARSCGTLVVCTDVDGQREAIGEDLKPFMARPADAVHLAERIMAALQLPKLRARELRERTARDVRERFAWRVIAAETLAYYTDIMRQHALPQKSV